MWGFFHASAVIPTINKVSRRWDKESIKLKSELSPSRIKTAKKQIIIIDKIFDVFIVPLRGVEPLSQAPQACILSIEL